MQFRHVVDREPYYVRGQKRYRRVVRTIPITSVPKEKKTFGVRVREHPIFTCWVVITLIYLGITAHGYFFEHELYSQTAQKFRDASPKVWLTRTGNAYHVRSHYTGSFPIPLFDAIQNRFSPCDVCSPPQEPHHGPMHQLKEPKWPLHTLGWFGLSYIWLMFHFLRRGTPNKTEPS
jgi:hypothetical protein